MTEVISRIDKGIEYIEKKIMATSGILLLSLLIFVVFARYFCISTAYEGELTKLFHIWMVFFGASWLIKSEGHPGVEILKVKIIESPNINIIVKKIYLTYIYVIMLSFVFLAFSCGIQLMPLYARQKTIYFGISYAFVYGGGIFGMLFMIIRCFLKISKIWKGEK